MKKVILLIYTSLPFLALSQDLIELKPKIGKKLDFGPEVQKEWKVRDDAMSALSAGDKSWEELSEEEKSVFEKYGEVYENMWDIVGGGCSWYCGGGPKEVSGSSYLKSQGNNNYEPKNAHDLDYKNVWVEGVQGTGVGEYLEYIFASGSPRITEIIVVNGYVKNESVWKANARVKKLKVLYNDIPLAVLNLEDIRAEQHFGFDPIGNKEEQLDWVLKFEIMEVYPGDKYDDTVISEIYFDGIDVH